MDTRELIENVEEVMRLVDPENTPAQLKLTAIRLKLKMAGRDVQWAPEDAEYVNKDGQYFKRELLGPKGNKVWWHVWSPTIKEWLVVCGEPSNVDKLVKL